MHFCSSPLRTITSACAALILSGVSATAAYACAPGSAEVQSAGQTCIRATLMFAPRISAFSGCSVLADYIKSCPDLRQVAFAQPNYLNLQILTAHAYIYTGAALYELKKGHEATGRQDLRIGSRLLDAVSSGADSTQFRQLATLRNLVARAQGAADNY
jgi:hypothetical protein